MNRKYIFLCLFLICFKLYSGEKPFDAFICISSEDEKYNVKGGIGTYLGILTKQVRSLYPDIEVYWITKSHNATDFSEKDEHGIQRYYLSDMSLDQERPFYSCLTRTQNEDKSLVEQQIFLNKANNALGDLLEVLQGKKIVIECGEWEGIAHQIYRTINAKNILKATRIHTPLAVTMLFNHLPLSTVNKLQLLHEFEVLNYSDCVSSCTDYMKGETIKYVLGINQPFGKDIKVIPNPIDSKNYRPGIHKRKESLAKINAVLEKEFVSENTYNIYVIGSVETRKGAELVIKSVAEVAHKIPEARFCFFGHHGGNASKELTANTKISPDILYDQIPPQYHHQVAFTGYIDHAQIPLIIESGDVFPIMYLGDNFPGTVAEIALMEKPILALQRGGLNEMLQNEKGEILSYKLGSSLETAPEELAKGLLDLYQNKKLREEIGYNLRRLIQSKYQPEKITSNIIDYYHDSLKKKLGE